MSGSSDAPGRVAQIIEAAEQAAEELRLDAERRARERIAEGDRAANMRVAAAEEEAKEILAGARREAEATAASARETVKALHDAADKARSVAEDEAVTIRSQAVLDADKIRDEAQDQAKEIVEGGREDSRALVAEAHAVAGDVIQDGTVLSDHLRELSDSLRTNATQLLRDVQLAHATLTARLDQAAPGYKPPRRGQDPPDGDFDVPEFVPPR